MSAKEKERVRWIFIGMLEVAQLRCGLIPETPLDKLQFTSKDNKMRSNDLLRKMIDVCSSFAC